MSDRTSIRLIQSLGRLSGAAPDYKAGDPPAVSETWLSDPRGGWNLHTEANHWSDLYHLIDLLQIAGLSDSPFDPDDVKWITIPKTARSADQVAVSQPSGLTVALPQKVPTDTSASFAISLGINPAPFLLQQSDGDSIQLRLYAELPAIRFPAAGRRLFAFGRPDQPLRVGFELVNHSSTLVTLDKAYKGLRVHFSLKPDAAPEAEIQVSEDGTSFAAASPGFAAIQPEIDRLLAGPLSEWLKAKVNDETIEKTFGEVLHTLGVIDSGNQLAALETLEAIQLTRFLDGIFKALFPNDGESSLPVVKAGADGSEGVSLVKRKNEDDAGGKTFDFGLHVEMNEILLPVTNAIDNLFLHIGKDVGKGGSDWTKSEKDAGVSFLLLTRVDGGGEGELAPALDVVSVGYDLEAKDEEENLIGSSAGLSLHGLGARLYYAEEAGHDFVFGAVGKVNGLTVPLSKAVEKSKTDADGKGKADAVATELLDAATSNAQAAKPADGGGAKKEEEKKQKTVTFGFSAAWNARQSFDFQLFDKKDKRTDTVWLELDKTFGKKESTGAAAKEKTPAKYALEVKKIGIEWKNSSRTIGVLFTGTLNINLVKLAVYGLRFEISISDPSKWAILLDGADVTLAIPSEKFDLSGGLIRSEGKDGVKYIGRLMFRVNDFSFTLFAGMGSAPDEVKPKRAGATAAFVFLIVDYPLGGPEEFFFTGVSGGFGYNMLLDVPKIDEIPNFPLIAGTDKKTNPFGKTGDSPLIKLAEFLKIQPGQYWIAAGVAGTTYKLIKSRLLLAFQWGTDIIVELLGIMTARQPEDSDKPLLLLELAVRAIYDNNIGLLGVEGRLVKGSFVLSKELEVSGGFAMYFWTKHYDEGPPNIPDFVLTVGGYSPYFQKPHHYPDIPRVGITYKYSDNVSIEGGYYYALTPAAVMAGGFLKATYTSENETFKAWFNAEAHFLIEWSPVRYHIGVSVSVGASLTIHILGLAKTLSATIGASVDLWGQPFDWTATVDLYVFSITIPGGEKTIPARPKVEWSVFSDRFLSPAAGGSAGRGVNARRLAVAAAGGGRGADPAPKKQNNPRLLAKVISGLAATPQPDETFLGMIRAEGFAMEVATKVPVKTLSFNGAAIPFDPASFGVGPVQIKDEDFHSDLSVTLQREGRNYDALKRTLVTSSAPKALWSMNAQPLSADTLIPNVVMGLALSGPDFVPDRLVEIDVHRLLFNSTAFPGNGTFNWSPEPNPASVPIAADPWTAVQSTIDASAPARNAIAAVLGERFSLPAPLSVTKDYGAQFLQDPTYRVLGTIRG